MFQAHAGPAPRHHHRDPRHGPGYPPFQFRDLRDVLGRGRRGAALVRRGEIRPLILAALARRPMHGYEMMQELEEQSGGRWRPSAGSVYPTLQQLADEGLVTSEEVDGRRTYTLTDAGRAAASAASFSRRRWADAGSQDARSSQELMRQLIGAAMQIQRMGSPTARREADRILADARRQLYRLLADDQEVPSAEAGSAESDADPV
jgi:DNA-binding PadR family transcriptional regulator